MTALIDTAKFSIAVWILVCIGTCAGQESPPRPTATGTIRVGTKIDDGIKTLDSFGYDKETAFSWAKVNPDESYRWFLIDNGACLALVFSESSKSIIRMQVIVVPPELKFKGNERNFPLRSIVFHEDGSYVLHIENPARQAAAPRSSIVPQFPESKGERK